MKVDIEVKNVSEDKFLLKVDYDGWKYEDTISLRLLYILFARLFNHVMEHSEFNKKGMMRKAKEEHS